MDRWIRARDRGLTLLIWLVIILLIFWVLGYVVTALLLFVLAAILAAALTPLVALLHRWLPRWLAVLVVYLLVLAVVGGVGYLVLSTTIAQVTALVKELPTLLQPGTPGHPSAIERLLKPLGITQAQINQARQQLLSWVENSAGSIANSILPIITGIAGGVVDAILVIILSVYLVLDGPRMLRWLRTATPLRQRSRVVFLLDTLRRTVGGYIRGQLFMSTFIGVLVGAGMFFFGLPYALLLGVLAFFCEFIPILGVIISGAACILIALPTRGWVIALLVLGYFVIVHILEGDVVGPRVVGHVLGLHPIIAILALVAGLELFGIWGALFAAPVAGIIQTILVTLWTEWRKLHPEEFRRLGRGDDPPPETSLLTPPVRQPLNDHQDEGPQDSPIPEPSGNIPSIP